MWNNFYRKTRSGSYFISWVLLCNLLLPILSVDIVHAQATSTDPGTTQVEQPLNESDETARLNAVIDTGTAIAVDNTSNTANHNDTVTEPTQNTASSSAATSTPIEDTPAATSTATSSGDELPLADTAATTSSSTASSTAAATTTMVMTSQATTTNQATTSAASGDNHATSASGTAAVISGHALAYNNIVNLTNTNIINSTGFIAFLHQLFGQSTVDTRDLFDVFSNNTAMTTCAFSGCQSGQLEMFINSSSTINNTITVRADTGNNTATGSDAIISTGDAYAAANVTNIANTNIINANYLMLSFSNFGDLVGDVVLPGTNLLQKLFSGGGGSTVITDTQIHSQAIVSDTVSTHASTGGNTASGTDAMITTGNATSYSNVYNQINTTAINDDSFTLLFRVQGDWDGEIFGLPEGLSYEQTPGGILITNATKQYTSTGAPYEVSANIINHAEIVNDIHVEATTGNNAAAGTEFGYVETGNAYAAANVTNIANTNILGRNWGLLIFDIFGDWQGDISFGQPDLWIGGIAKAVSGHTGAGADIEYTLTISNLGDSAASDVLLSGELSNDLITLNDPLTDVSLGTLEPGETIEKTISGSIANTLPRGTNPVDLHVALSSRVPDKSLTNNSEVVTVLTENIQYRGGGSSRHRADTDTDEADLVITKTANQSYASPGDTVGYTLSITNYGGPVYDATLYDTLYDSTGFTTLTRNWPLQTIASNETINVTYDVQFATSTELGTHLNRAYVAGFHTDSDLSKAKAYQSMVATVPISLTNTVPEVLGVATTSTVCDPYLTSYLKRGVNNDDTQMLRLQVFLNTFTDSTVPLNGLFDTDSEEAVRQFQQTHTADILDPWGVTNPTGYVYYTTQKKINELYCAQTTSFPLTAEQNAEIVRSKFAANPTVTLPTSNPVPLNKTVAVDEAATLPKEPKSKPTINTPELPQPLLGNSDSMLSANQSSVAHASGSLFTKITNWFTKRLPNFWSWQSAAAQEE